MNWKNNCLVFFGIALISACNFGDFKNGPSLITISEIEEMISDGDRIQIIDVRPSEEYLQGHIHGAVNIWRNKLEDQSAEIQGMRLPREELEKLLGKLGMSDEEYIFLYDAKGNVDAARLWWILRSYGFTKVALIDGGFIQWRMAGLPIQEGPGIAMSGQFFLSDEELPVLATKTEIADKKYSQIIDVRTEEEFNGLLLKNGAIRGGHIPGAIRIDYVEFLNGGDMTLKTKDEILGLLKSKGLSESESTVVYCHSGVRSSLAFFALTEVAGMAAVANYDGSWSEWSADESLPAEAEHE